MLVREKTRPARPPSSISAKKFAQRAVKHPFLAIFRVLGELFRAYTMTTVPLGELFRAYTTTTVPLGELFRAHTHIRPSRAKNVAHEARQHGDIETRITSAPEKHAKNTHFSPAKAMAVSTGPPHRPAKATAVSDNQATWPTGPGRGACGRRLGQSAAPVGNIRYKRRQTNAIPIASRGPLLQTSSICVQKP